MHHLGGSELQLYTQKGNDEWGMLGKWAGKNRWLRECIGLVKHVLNNWWSTVCGSRSGGIRVGAVGRDAKIVAKGEVDAPIPSVPHVQLSCTPPLFRCSSHD